MEYNILMDFAFDMKELTTSENPDWEKINKLRDKLKEITAEDFGYNGDAWLDWLIANDYDTCYKGFYALRQQRLQQVEEDENQSE